MKHAGLIFLFILSLITVAHADQVYKWVDAQGNVHYSDKPHPGAEKVKIAPPQSYSAPADSGSTSAAGGDRRRAGPAVPTKYTLSIVSPKPEQTIWNTRSVSVSVGVSPGLSPGDTVTFELDGRHLGPLAGTSATFDDLDRGQHSVSAILTTAKGQVIKAGPVTFFLRQATVFHGKPPR